MKPRTVRLITPPTVEPVSLSEAKAHLRLLPEQEEDNAVVHGMISAARRLVEQRLGIAIATAQYRAKFPAGARVLELPNPPLLADETHGISVSVGEVEADYELDEDATPARLTLSETASAEVTVTYWAGGALAPQLRSAILLVVGHLYAHREAATTEAVGELPMGVEVLLASESVSGRW